MWTTFSIINSLKGSPKEFMQKANKKAPNWSKTCRLYFLFKQSTTNALLSGICQAIVKA